MGPEVKKYHENNYVHSFVEVSRCRQLKQQLEQARFPPWVQYGLSPPNSSPTYQRTFLSPSVAVKQNTA